MRIVLSLTFVDFRAVNATVFYGLSLNSTNLSGNKYINFALVCLVEIPGYTLAWVRDFEGFSVDYMNYFCAFRWR